MDQRIGPERDTRSEGAFRRRQGWRVVRVSNRRGGVHGRASSHVSAADRERAEEYLRKLLVENALLIEDAHERMRRIR